MSIFLYNLYLRRGHLRASLHFRFILFTLNHHPEDKKELLYIISTRSNRATCELEAVFLVKKIHKQTREIKYCIYRNGPQVASFSGVCWTPAVMEKEAVRREFVCHHQSDLSNLLFRTWFGFSGTTHISNSVVTWRLKLEFKDIGSVALFKIYPHVISVRADF